MHYILKQSSVNPKHETLSVFQRDNLASLFVVWKLRTKIRLRESVEYSAICPLISEVDSSVDRITWNNRF